MDPFEATQVLRDETPSNNCEDEVGTLIIGSQRHIIRRGFSRIGRAPQCLVVIDDATVSKVHAEIQAGAEGAFVSDLRSSNGTKIKDVQFKPFYYYSINDGDVIYFGRVKAVYKTAGSTAIDDVLLVPETPVVSKNRNGTERFSTGAGNISESFLNDSSMYGSDASMIPATQETERKRPTFQMPTTPVPRSASNRTVEVSNGVKSRDAVRKSDVDGTETRNDVDAALQPPGAKRQRLERQNAPGSENNIHEAQSMPSSIASRKEPARSHQPDNIYEAETQAMPVTMSEKNNSMERRSRDDIFEAETQGLAETMSEKNNSQERKNRDDIFEAETQALPVTMYEKKSSQERRNRDDIFDAETQDLAVTVSEKNNSEERGNRDDIFEAETQALPVTMSEKKNSQERKNRDDTFEAETQALSVAMSNKKNSKERKNRDDIFEAETQAMKVSISEREGPQSRHSIYDAETQAMEVTGSGESNSIFDAETQVMEVPKFPKSGEKIDKRRGSSVFEAEARTTSRAVEEREANGIHEAETQMAQVTSSESGEPIGVQENIHDVATQILDKNKSSNETVESSFRSSSSRDRLRLSSTPPSSPENVEIQESQNLLEIAETPLLAYEKNREKISSREEVPGPAEKSKIGEKKCRIFRRVRTIPESSESETDDEKVPTRFVRKSKPSNVIEDSSEEPTDEENVFGSIAIARGSNYGNANGKKDSSLRTPKGVGTLPDEIEEQDSDAEKKKDASMPGDSPTGLFRRNAGILPKKMEGTPPRGRDALNGSGDSPTGVPRTMAEPSSNKNGETSTGKSGRSSLPLLGRKEQDSPEKNRGNAPVSAGVGATPSGDSPSGDTISPKKFEATSKFGRSPLRLPRKGDQDPLKKNQHGASEKEEAKSNLFGDSPRKDKNATARNQGEASEGSKNSKKIGDSMKMGEDSPKNRGEEFEEPKSRKKIGDSDDPAREIKADKSAKFQPRSNIFGRPSLRLSRKRDDRAPNKIAEKSAKEEEDSIFEVATQRVVYDEVGNIVAPQVDEVDIDLLPTQILDVPSSTPISRKSKYRKNRAGAEQLDGDDLHTAPTQLPKESPQRENTDADREKTKAGGKIDLDDSLAATLGNLLGEEPNDDQLHGEVVHDGPIRMPRKSPRRGIVDADRAKAKDGGKTIDLDDSIATNLGNLLGEEANNDHLDDESTQLMTQNLVDILRPTQTFNEDTRHRKSSPRTSGDNFREDANSPARKKIYAPGTLGFVDGEARDSSRELVSADSSPIKASKENKKIAAPSAKSDETEALANLDDDDDDDDDIFRGLPEVNLYSTLSYPGSPAPSSSSADDFPPPVRRTSVPSKKRPRASSPRRSSTTKRSDSPDRDSPITPKKSRVTKRSASSYRIIEDVLDDDSEEDFDYQDLKRMADRLLASGSSTGTTSRRSTASLVAELGDDDKFAKIPVPAPRRPGIRKIVERKKVAPPKRRAVKLSGGSSSIVVSDVKAESSDSTVEPRKSTRRRKPAGERESSSSSSTGAATVKGSGGEESQEIEAILGNSVGEDRPMLSRKSYVKIHMTRCDEVDEDDAVPEAPKPTRTRRTVSTARKIPETPATPARARRTIAVAPGIPGDDEDRKILFTGVNDDKYFKIVAKLGGTVVSDPAKATVLITDKVRRTFKFLCAVARGIRVVSINWLVESGKSSRFLDCEGFILKDPDAEAKYKFTLDKSLRIAKTRKLLDGYTIIVTPKVNQPEVHELKGMVEACGGRLLVRPGRNWTAKTVIISREEDYEVAKAYLAKVPKRLKITVQTTEFILTGILRQEINLVEHELNFA